MLPQIGKAVMPSVVRGAHGGGPMDGTVEAMVRSCVSGRCERRRESQRQHSRGSKPRHVLLLRFTETRLGLYECFIPARRCVRTVIAARVSISERADCHLRVTFGRCAT